MFSPPPEVTNIFSLYSRTWTSCWRVWVRVLPAGLRASSSSSASPGAHSCLRCSSRNWFPSLPATPRCEASVAAPSARRPAAHSGESTGTCAGTADR